MRRGIGTDHRAHGPDGDRGAVTGAQLPVDAARDSYNVLPALRGEARTAPIREATVHHSIQGMFAIRQGPWKYIDGRGSGGWTKGGDDGPEGQLYDLENDPAETTNLYEAHPEIVARLGALLARYKDSGRSVADRGR